MKLHNLKLLIINSLIFIVIFSSFCCTNTDNTSLKDVNYILNKKTIIYDEDITSATMYLFQKREYPLEADIQFNSKGEIIKKGKQKGEGLLYNYRFPNSLELSLDKEYLDYKITIDTVNNLIIDNNNKVSDFKINYKAKIIYTPLDNNGRVIIFEFN